VGKDVKKGYTNRLIDLRPVLQKRVFHVAWQIYGQYRQFSWLFKSSVDGGDVDDTACHFLFLWVQIRGRSRREEGRVEASGNGTGFSSSI
jgi:hypothetical protein